MSSINQSKSHYVPKLAPLGSVLKTRKYQLIILGSGIIYSLVYMFAVGTISYYPGVASLKVSSPIVSAESIGIMSIPASSIFIFILYYVIAFLIISSFLVGLNIALMFYSRKITKLCSCDRSRTTNVSIASRGIFGILPSFFTSFACCGSGLMALVIGPTAFSSLALYSSYMAPITIAVLASGTFIMSRKISRLNTGITDRYVNEEEKRV